MMRRQEVSEVVSTALECSVYVAPKAPGLTHDELFEVCRQLGYQQGEVSDALQSVAAPMRFGDKRLMRRMNLMWGEFHFTEEPDFRNVSAFDFVCNQLQDVARSQGIARAQIERSVLIARGVASGLPEHDLEMAVTIFVLSEHMTEKDGILRFVSGRENYLLPSAQVDQARETRGRRVSVQQKPTRARVHPVVRDVIDRRTDGRAAAADPLDAFAEELGRLGYAPFRLWWKQMVAELRRLDTALSPVAVAVLAAALVEGVLTFVVKHARGLGNGAFGSKDFEREPRTWKIDDLVSSACSGRDAAILDVPSRTRADELIKVRQRIHAGRMLSDYPNGVPDLRPEEADEAKTTVKIVVRRVLDWLLKFPGTEKPK